MVESIKVLIVDDQPRARRSLIALLATCFQVEKAREAANGRDALALVEECLPDLILMDVRMPEMDGLQATRLIKTRWPQVKIIVLSLYAEYMDEALAAGADAFVSKGAPADKLLTTLSAITQSNNCSRKSGAQIHENCGD
jgi:YesN/AraC family two-component response regulator